MREKWLGRKDSNLQLLDSKSSVLPIELLPNENLVCLRGLEPPPFRTSF